MCVCPKNAYFNIWYLIISKIYNNIQQCDSSSPPLVPQQRTVNHFDFVWRSGKLISLIKLLVKRLVPRAVDVRTRHNRNDDVSMWVRLPIMARSTIDTFGEARGELSCQILRYIRRIWKCVRFCRDVIFYGRFGRCSRFHEYYNWHIKMDGKRFTSVIEFRGLGAKSFNWVD